MHNMEHNLGNFTDVDNTTCITQSNCFASNNDLLILFALSIILYAIFDTNNRIHVLEEFLIIETNKLKHDLHKLKTNLIRRGRFGHDEQDWICNAYLQFDYLSVKPGTSFIDFVSKKLRRNKKSIRDYARSHGKDYDLNRIYNPSKATENLFIAPDCFVDNKLFEIINE